MINPAKAFKMETTKIHLVASLLIVLGAAAALSEAGYLHNPAVATAIILGLWLAYSAIIAKTTSTSFAGSFQKALFLDSLTYVPLLLPLAVKVAFSAIGADFGKYSQFSNLPVELALGAAIAANIAGKIIFLPKNIDATLEKAAWNKKIKITVVAAVVAYFLFFSVASVMKHESFNSTAFDMAIFDQTMWGYSQGHGTEFFNTVRGLVLLGDHMHPILFAYAQLYRLFPMPDTLLVLQSLALALGALPIYLMGRKRIESFGAAMVAGAYLLYPSLQYINLFDFHPEAFVTPLLLFAFYFADGKKYLAAAAMLALIGLSKEHFPLALISVGAFIFLQQKKRKIGLAFAAVGIAWLIVNFKILLPHFAQGGYGYVQWYGYLGNSLGEIAKNAITQPQLIISNLSSPDKAAYAILLLFPIGIMVALLGLPFLLLGAPFIAINLLRGDNISAAILYQHNAELIPFIFLAAIAGMPRLVKLLGKLKLNNTKAAAGAFVLMTSIVATATYGPFATIYDWGDFSQSYHVEIGKKLIKEIPADASVSADPYTLPHLTHRKEAYMFPNPFVSLMYGSKEPPPIPEYVLLDLSRVSPTYDGASYAKFIGNLADNSEYGLVKIENDYALFKKFGNYAQGLCKLNAYFSTSYSSAVKMDLKEALGPENKIYLSRCQGNST